VGGGEELETELRTVWDRLLGRVGEGNIRLQCLGR